MPLILAAAGNEKSSPWNKQLGALYWQRSRESLTLNLHLIWCDRSELSHPRLSVNGAAGCITFQAAHPETEILSQWRWRHGQLMADNLLKRSIKFYLLRLKCARNWPADLQVGTKAIVVDAQLPCTHCRIPTSHPNQTTESGLWKAKWETAPTCAQSHGLGVRWLGLGLPTPRCLARPETPVVFPGLFPQDTWRRL